MNSRYRQTQFHASASRLVQLPEDAVREVAFAGRSNAGKSSALNRLTDNSKLARTSRTPGRTQLINHFSVADGRYLVDLPGYGFAKVSRQQRNAWLRLLTDYFTERRELVGVVIVMDSRHPLTDNDWQMIELQQRSMAELHVLLTKCDKLSRKQANEALMSTRSTMEDAGIEATLQTFSATAGTGVDDLSGVLDSWLFDQPEAQ